MNSIFMQFQQTIWPCEHKKYIILSYHTNLTEIEHVHQNWLLKQYPTSKKTTVASNFLHSPISAISPPKMATSINQQSTFYLKLFWILWRRVPSLGKQAGTEGAEVSVNMLAMLLKFVCFIHNSVQCVRMSGCNYYILSKDFWWNKSQSFMA